MTKIQQEALKKDTVEFLTKNHLNVLGLRAAVDNKVIENIFAENFTAVDEKYLQKVHAVVKSEVVEGLYQTTDCNAFLEIRDEAIKYKMMIGVTGETGTGKSYMSQAVAKGENVLYYNVHLKKSSRVFFQDLLLNMRICCSGNISELIDAVAGRLNSLEKPLLIIDEADKMHRDIRAAIHTLRDRTIKNCGILLVGMPALKNDLIKGKEAGKPGFAEFYRRVNIWHHLEGLKADEIKIVLEGNGIKEAALQREFRQFTRFGELVNEINLYKRLNN